MNVVGTCAPIVMNGCKKHQPTVNIDHLKLTGHVCVLKKACMCNDPISLYSNYRVDLCLHLPKSIETPINLC